MQENYLKAIIIIIIHWYIYIYIYIYLKEVIIYLHDTTAISFIYR